MTASLDPEAYSLHPEQHERIFRERIVPQLTGGLRGHERPCAIVLGGQPGAGKSAMQSAAEQELAARGGVLSVVGDDLRGYHPRYEELLARDDKTAAFFTDRDSGRWVEKLIAHAKLERVDLVIEGTMRLQEKVVQTFADLRAAGYEVQARALAVRAEFSQLGIRQRYEALLAARGHARFTTPEAHQAAYEGMPLTVARLERDGFADEMRLYARGNVLLYSNRLVNGAWQRPPTASRVLLRKRTLPMTTAEKVELALGWQGVWTRMQDRSASPAELELVRPAREASLEQVHADWRAQQLFQARVHPQVFRETERAVQSRTRGRGR